MNGIGRSYLSCQQCFAKSVGFCMEKFLRAVLPNLEHPYRGPGHFGKYRTRRRKEPLVCWPKKLPVLQAPMAQELQSEMCTGVWR